MTALDIEAMWERAAAQCDAALFHVNTDRAKELGLKVRGSAKDDLDAAKELHASSPSAECDDAHCVCRHAALMAVACRRAASVLPVGIRENGMALLYETAMEMIELYLEGLQRLN